MAAHLVLAQWDRIMLTSNKTSSENNRGEALKPGAGSLLEAIERATETTDVTIRNRVSRRRVHVDLLMQLAMKKSILHIKLRDGPSANRSNSNKSMDSGPMGNMSKCLLIITPILLLKPTCNKTRFIALNGAIRACLDFVDPLARDSSSRRRKRNKIPSDSALKSSNLLSHSELPLRMGNRITIGGRLRERGSRRHKTKSSRTTNRTPITKVIAWRRHTEHRGRRAGWWCKMRTSSVMKKYGRT